MTTDIVLIIIGAVLVLLAFINNIKVKGSSLNWINAKLRVPFGIAGVLLIMYGGYSAGASNYPGQIEQAEAGNILQVDLPVNRVQIISPIDGDMVKCRILTMGLYPEKHDKDIWVLLKPSDDKYYPQSDHTNTSYKRNGEWQVITRFGGDQDELFDVIVYETDSLASAYFSSTIQNWKNASFYPGLKDDDIPSGAKEVDRLVVSLQASCRGVH